MVGLPRVLDLRSPWVRPTRSISNSGGVGRSIDRTDAGWERGVPMATGSPPWLCWDA